MGKLNIYRNSEPHELAELHPADRLMVKLIQIDRLGPRIEGMLYNCAFEERWSLLDEGARKLTEAGQALLNAKHFKELLSVRFHLASIWGTKFISVFFAAYLVDRELYERHRYKGRSLWFPSQQY